MLISFFRITFGPPQVRVCGVGGDFDLGGPNVGNRLDRASRLVDGEALTLDNSLVARLVQVSESLGELDLHAIDRNRTVGSLFLAGGLGQIALVDRQEPAHSRPLILEIACRTIDLSMVNDVRLEGPENEAKHVVKVHPDVGGDAT